MIPAADRASEESEAFTAALGHALRTQLTAWLGFTELLGELPEIAGHPRAAEYLGRCRSAGRRTVALIDGLFDYAVASRPPQPEPVGLDDVVPGLLDELGGLAGNCTVTWSGPPITADPVQLRTLLGNLLDNALRYRPAGRPGRVAITTQALPRGVRIRIADNGDGVAPRRRGEVLMPFIRLRADGAGSGIGLAICRRIVDNHDGTLALTTTRGGGLTVTAVFPTAPDRAPTG